MRAARIASAWFIAHTLLMALSAHAAEIALIREEPWPIDAARPLVPKCNIRLTGDIALQDLARLRQATARLRKGKDRQFYLCLDSPGGSYEHGIELARFLLGPDGANLGTVIESSTGCYSACALVFLAGNTKGQGYQFPARYLHVGAKLGFHAPFLKSLPQGPYDRVTVINAFRAAQKSIERLIDVFGVPAGGVSSVPARPWVSASLFQLLLSQDPEAFFMIDSIDKAGRWGIALYGYKHPYYTNPPDFDGIKRACWNLRSWSNDAYASGKWTATIANEKFAPIELDFGTLGRRTKHSLLIDPNRYCVLNGTLSTAGPPHYLSVHVLAFHTRPVTDIVPPETATRIAHPWMMMPPETQLAELTRRAAD